MLIVLMCHMTYFNTTSHFMAMSLATKINFLRLENFYRLYIASTLPLHADRFDVPHDLLQHCFTLHVRSEDTKVNFWSQECLDKLTTFLSTEVYT